MIRPTSFTAIAARAETLADAIRIAREHPASSSWADSAIGTPAARTDRVRARARRSARRGGAPDAGRRLPGVARIAIATPSLHAGCS